jgi:selenide,water dikinase
VVASLTSLSHGAGCGCKIGAADLDPVLALLPRSDDPNLLVGTETADDAGVYRVAEDLAIVQSVDFFTPIVDDPYEFGRIAAANALSDLYAMAARPITALNVVAFSLQELGAQVLGEILRGGQDAVTEAGAVIVGGHSIDDPEPKYGLAVTGVAHPDRILTNAGGRAGDVLVLSKPLGVGVASTASKRGRAPDGLTDRAIAVMRELNRDASLAACDAGARALTDVTGFGLLGHLHELARASGLAAEVDAQAVPAIPGTLELLAGPDAPIAGGTRRNRAHAERFASFAEGVSEARRWLVCDAMTSGGLLAAVPAASAPAALGTPIGRLVTGEPGHIRVL